MPINEAEIAVDANVLDARNLCLERFEPFGDAVGVVAALGVVGGGQAEQDDVTNHALTIETSGGLGGGRVVRGEHSVSGDFRKCGSYRE